jgi:hypothetical protein
VLAEGSDDFWKIEQSRAVAECYFDLRRIWAARDRLFVMMTGLPDPDAHDAAARKMEKISRYETRAMSKQRRAFRMSKD